MPISFCPSHFTLAQCCELTRRVELERLAWCVPPVPIIPEPVGERVRFGELGGRVRRPRDSDRLREGFALMGLTE